MDAIKLTEDQQDLLKEIFNLGIGKAANALSKLSEDRYEVMIGVPEVKIIPLKELVSFLDGESDGPVSAVFQKYTGPFEGRACMLYSHDASLKLASLMLGSDIPIEELSDLETDALTEIGNLLLNACLGSLATTFEKDIETAIPKLRTGEPAILLNCNEKSENNQVIFIKAAFEIAEKELTGFITFLFNEDKITSLIECIDIYHKKLFGE